MTARNRNGMVRLGTIAATGLCLTMLCLLTRPSYGQISEEVLKRQISDYAIMHGIVKDLTDEELRSLAVYLQSL